MSSLQVSSKETLPVFDLYGFIGSCPLVSLSVVWRDESLSFLVSRLRELWSIVSGCTIRFTFSVCLF